MTLTNHRGAATVPAPDTGSGAATTPTDWALRLVTALPDRLLMAFLWAMTVVSITVMFGVFYPALVIVASVALVVVTWRIRPVPVRADPRSALGAAVAFEIAFAWVLANRHYRAELLSIARDPGVYTIRAWWLIHHHSPNIPIGSATHAVLGVPGAAVSSGGFPQSGDLIKPQGNSLVPGLLAMAGWVGGGPAMLQANLVLGALGLLAVYAFSRRLMGPIWALAPMITLAVSMPMVYFSRAPYTEPAALLVTFIGLTLLWSAWRTESVGQFAAAGIAFGAAQMARIDGGVAVLGVCFGLGLVAVFAVGPALRRRARGYLLAFAVAAAAMMGLGTLDLVLNSPAYLEHQRTSLEPLFAGCLATVLVMLALSFVPLGRLRTFVLARRISLARTAAVLVVVVSVIMLSRPLWWQGHFIRDAPIKQMLQVYQQRGGAAPDGTRSYDEQTLHWIAWYMGWPAVILAGIGLAWLAWRVLRHRDPRQLALLGTFAVVATLYLNDVNITPIQIWAMRRLLPVVVPVMTILAVWVAARISRGRPRLLWISALLVAGVALSPALSWNQLVTVVEEGGEFAEVDAACQAITGDKVVVMGDIKASGNYLPSTRVVCDKESVYLGRATASQLATLARNWGGGDITVLSLTEQYVPWTTPPAHPTHSGNYPSWPSPIFSRPVIPDYEQRSIWAGHIQPDGTVVPR